MSWSFETVVTTRGEAERVISYHATVPEDVRSLMRGCLPHTIDDAPIFGEGISAILRSHGHIDPGRPCNFTFELVPINNADNGRYK